jgi:Domain of unknown function (DUF5664)
MSEIGIKHDGFDTGDFKERYDLVPPQSLKEIVKVLTHGAKKYGDYNWSHITNWEPRYTGALLRHIEAWRSGVKYDQETGIHHLAHAATNAIFLLFLDTKNDKHETFEP